MQHARPQDHGPAAWDKSFKGGFMKMQDIDIANFFGLEQVEQARQTAGKVG
jgi:hypothetical protein